ncbi:MAG TPA: ABC transporter ATP-binding protein [Tepidisphaeraceae bacterium]|jgi:ABC-type multidrug transport system ATPase subunit
MNAMIQIDQVRKRFGRARVLDGVSFDVLAGQSIALWGSNGAGKTTLIRCLLGLIDFEGSIRVAGLDVRREGKRVRRLLGYVPQELAFYDDFRVIEAARYIARIRGADAGDCEPGLQSLGLLDHARKRVRELSGGMKQRLALAVALLNDPPVLVLDEPTSNLDSAGRGSLMELLVGLKAAGKTILFISHRPEEVRGLADRVLTLESGRVVTDVATTRLHLAGDALAADRLDQFDEVFSTDALEDRLEQVAIVSGHGIRRFA